jgi:hypothetical protein
MKLFQILILMVSSNTTNSTTSQSFDSSEVYKENATLVHDFTTGLMAQNEKKLKLLTSDHASDNTIVAEVLQTVSLGKLVRGQPHQLSAKHQTQRLQPGKRILFNLNGLWDDKWIERNWWNFKWNKDDIVVLVYNGMDHVVVEEQFQRHRIVPLWMSRNAITCWVSSLEIKKQMTRYEMAHRRRLKAERRIQELKRQISELRNLHKTLCV